jgi:outer membrane protein OmpA-like peptidoglycan-associated protein
MKVKITLILLFMIRFAFAQGFKESYAQQLSNRLEFVAAYPVWAELSTTLINKQKGKWNYLRMATEAAYKSEQFEKSFYWDSILIAKKQATAQDMIVFFDLLCLNNKHALLSPYIDSALLIFPKDSLIQIWKQKAPIVMGLLNNKTNYEVSPIRPGAKGEEYGAIPYKRALLYVSNEYNTGFVNSTYGRTGQNYSNIGLIEDAKNPSVANGFWEQIKNKDLWTEIPPTKTHDGPISFSKDYKQAFVTSNQTTTNENNSIKFSRLQLKIYSRTTDGWKEDKTFDWNSPDFSNGHAVLDADKNLIFASDRPGGFGGVDLYKCIWKNDHWGNPVNMGPSINTSQNEMFPFVSNKGNLYFASNGWPGLGGLDIFKWSAKDSSISHLGIPINSNDDDFAFYFNEINNSGYLSSNRNNRKDQIFSLLKIVEGIELQVNTITCNENTVSNIPLTITDKSKNTSQQVTTDENGAAIIKMQKGRDYLISFEGNEYSYPDSLLYHAKTNGRYEKNLKIRLKNQVTSLLVQDEKLKPLEGVMLNFYNKKIPVLKVLTPANGQYAWTNVGQELKDSVYANFINHNDVSIKIQKAGKDRCNDTLVIPLTFIKKQADEYINLDLILYDFDKYFLRPEGKFELEKLVKYMKARPELIVELSSHTDSRGEYDYNITLSNNRSQSCIDYIISKGIDADHIIAKGYGESKLVNPCSDNVPCSDEEHQQNRRTELKLLINTK